MGVSNPTKKLDILGDIQIRGTTSSIRFEKGPSLTAISLTQLLQIPEQLSASFNYVNQSVNQLSTSVNQSFNSIETTLANVQASINILETQTGASPIQVNGNYDNQLLKINLNGEITPFIDLYSPIKPTTF